MKNHLLTYLSIPLDKLLEPKKTFLLLSEFFQWSGKNQGGEATFKNWQPLTLSDWQYVNFQKKSSISFLRFCPHYILLGAIHKWRS